MPDTAPAREVEVVTVIGVRRKPQGLAGPVAFPDWTVTLDGVDMADKINPRLMRLSISERRGEEADQLDITLDASDNALALPATGAKLTVSLGWKGGGGTTAGLIGKGTFVVDEIEHSGPPDTVTIRAKSADFTAALRLARNQIWRAQTLGKVLGDIAARHGLTLAVADALKSKSVALVTQSRESDLALIKRLGRAHDAVATIKAGRLIFAPAGQARSASGTAIPEIIIKRTDQDRHSFRVEGRETYGGVSATWYNRATAKTVTVTVGKAEGAKKLTRRYPSEIEAKRAAEAAWSRLKRAPKKLTLSLALGRPDIAPETPIKVSGFHTQIDAEKWIVTEINHELGTGGSVSGLTLELRG